MSSTQKRGFRLPWGADRDPDEVDAAAPVDSPALDLLMGGKGRDLLEGDVAGADTAPEDLTMDAAPAASDVPETTAEDEMFETETPPSKPDNGARPDGAKPGSAWPPSDRGPSAPSTVESPRAGSRPAIRVEGEPGVRRRENPLVAGLVKAMREAAISSRDESISRLQAESTARTEEIRTEATTESASLRKGVDDDITGIRDWSKAEMARIRQETEDRIEARRAEAIAESKRHGEGVERRIEAVQTTVSAFEAEMGRFFELLLAESDPAKLATLAEQAPEPPDLTGDLPTTDLSGHAPNGTGPDGDIPGGTVALEANAAAEAEAEATEGLDMMDAGNWPTEALAARLGDMSTLDTDEGGSGQSRLLVNGLASVAAISSFKGAIGQLASVRSVSVTSGEKGVFIFNVSHAPEVDLGSAIAGLSGFAVRITEASAETLTVTVHEAAA